VILATTVLTGRGDLEDDLAELFLSEIGAAESKPKKLQRLQLTAENPFSTFNPSFPFWPRLGLPR
jgi:hypothetical protein